MSCTYIYKCDACGKRLPKDKKCPSGRRSWAVRVRFDNSDYQSHKGEFCLLCAKPLQAHVKALIEGVPRG